MIVRAGLPYLCSKNSGIVKMPNRRNRGSSQNPTTTSEIAAIHS